MLRKIKKILCRVLYELLKYLPKSNTPVVGPLCKGIRTALVRGFVQSCGRDVNIEHGAVVPSALRIGDHSGVGVNCSCDGIGSIGSYVMMGPECVFFSRNHAFENTEIPMCQQGFQPSEKCEIGDDVWIGRRVMVLPGVKLGSHSVIGAGAVVTKDVPEWAIAAGNPAVVKKYRKATERPDT